MLEDTAGRFRPFGRKIKREGSLSAAIREIVEQDTNGSGDDSDF
jgi:hypothetical protein